MSKPKTRPEPDVSREAAAQAEAAPCEPEMSEAEIAEDETSESEMADAEALEEALAEADVILTPEDQIVVLEAEVAELKDQLLRALAETENVRRRAQRDREEAMKYAATNFARDVLAVADNLARATESVSEEAAKSEAVANLLAGVELTRRELAAVFERHHITKLEPHGERLDPHRHEAMYEIPDETSPSGTVLQVVQPGYMLHDRLLRPARVGVAKGKPAPKPAPDPAAEPSDQDDESSS